jgi:GNAT superfamily N-acetyltransferase
MGISKQRAQQLDRRPPDDHGQARPWYGAGHDSARGVHDGCRITDWRAIVAAALACFPDLSHDDISYHLISNRSGTRVLRRNGRVAGFAINDSSHSQECAWLEKLGVAPEFQRQGLGALILADFEAFCLSLGYIRVELAVNRNNAAAIALYVRSGYTLVHREGGSSGENLTFGKQLDSDVRQPVRIQRPGRLARAGYRTLFWLLVGRAGR